MKVPLSKEDVLKSYESYVMTTYGKTDLVLVKGEGPYVWDSEGNRYIDLFPGWAVSSLGHCNKRVAEAVCGQVNSFIHIPNNFYNPWQAELAARIVAKSFPGKIFFSNSGAEANECAIKAARKYGQEKRYKIITMNKSFHGRTMATLSATAQEKVKTGFYPILEGFTHVDFNDIGAVEKAADDRTVAVMLEVIQGEGGVNVADTVYMKKLRDLCDRRDMLLIVDEVQTCGGRTGKFFAYQHYDVLPDIVSMAKALGGGLPIGATLCGEKVKEVLGPGSHGSTYGGSPVACAAALAVMDEIEDKSLIQNTLVMGDYLVSRLKNFAGEGNLIGRVKGKGLMIGVELKVDGKRIASECMNRGLLINCTQDTVLRIFPPMNIDKKVLDESLDILEAVLKEEEKI